MHADAVSCDSRSLWAGIAVAAGAAAGLLVVEISPAVTAALAAGAALLVASLRRIEIGLVALLFTLPLDAYGRVLTSPVSITVFHLVLGVALLAWLTHVVADARSWYRFSWTDAVGGSLVLAALWSLPGSADPFATAFSAVRVAFLWAFASLYVNTVRTADSLKTVFRWLLATAAAMAVLGLAQGYVPGFDFGSMHVQDSLSARGGLVRAAGFFDDPNLYAGFMSAGFVAFLALLVRESRGRSAFWVATGAALTGAAVLATFSRTAWLGALVGVVVVVLTAPRGRRNRLIAAGVAVAIALAALAPGTVVERAVSIVDIQNDRSNLTRWGMYVSTVQMIGDDWVFGTGLSAYEDVYPGYRQPGTHLSVVKPHQLPLALWAEMGVAGLMAEVVLLAALASMLYRRRPRGWDPLEAASAAALVTLLVGTLFQYYLYFEYLWIFFALLVVATRLARERDRGSEEVGPT